MSDEGIELWAIIVSYNTREMTLECLRVLHEELVQTRAEVILVDNASTDGTAEAVRKSWPGVRFIESGKNVGFAAGNNLGMREARGRYLLLLNSDAFPKVGAVAAMRVYLEEHPEATVVGCVLRLASWSIWLVVRPGQRKWTQGKMRFASWLLVRQMTHWRLS
jgi:hypothetical protein